MVADSLLPFYLTGPQTCSYLPENQSYSLFLDPEHSLNPTLYSRLSQQGFRRNGNLVYRPHCRPCQACIPTRVLVDRFKANRSQRRNWKTNANLEVKSINSDFHEEHFALYSRYLNARHAEGEMAHSTPEDYRSFLLSNWSTTKILEVREKGALLAGIVSDYLDDGLSAVYTYYEPTALNKGLGKFAVLLQIQHTQKLGLPHLYLGYWIKQCKKMAYKVEYGPVEYFDGQTWGPSLPNSR